MKTNIIPSALVLALMLAACGGNSSDSAAPTQTPTLTLASTSMSASTPASLAAAMGRPDRLLVGLGAASPIPDMQAQGISPDIIDTYLVAVTG